MREKFRRIVKGIRRSGSKAQRAAATPPAASRTAGRLKKLRGVARRAAGHCVRWAWYGGAVVLALLAVLFTVARLVLPMVAEKHADIESYLSRFSTHQVRIEHIEPHWDGPRPGLKIQGLRIYPLDSIQPAVQLSEIRVSVALLPLLLGRVDINRLIVVKPRLALERLADGRLRVSGFSPDVSERGEGNEEFIGWIFKQGRLEIEDGEVQWFDHQDSTAALNLEHVNLTLKNDGDHHRLQAEAKFPAEICGTCSFVADVTGNPIHSRDWSGRLYLKTEALHVGALPKIAREIFPGELHGAFDTELWTEWAENRPEEVRGRVAVNALRLSTAQLKQPIIVRRANADVLWEARSEGWRLDLTNFELGLGRPSWRVDRLRIVHRAKESTIQVKHIDLDDTSALAKTLGESHRFAHLWAKLDPGGSIDQLKFQIRGPLTAPEGFSVQANFENMRMAPYGRFPGFRGVSGRISANQNAGKIDFESNAFSVELPDLFRAPLTAERASGRVTWKKSVDGWEVNGDDLSVSGTDGEADGKMLLRIPPNRETAPHLKLRVEFRNGNGAHAARYFPVKKLKPRTLAWMKSSFLGGTISNGFLIFDGPIDQYPFDAGVGRFELRGHVRDGVYQYLNGWEPITGAEVDVVVTGRKVLVTGSGKIGVLDITQAVVNTTRETPSGSTIVRVNAKVHGPAGETARVLRNVRTPNQTIDWKKYLPEEIRAQGDGTLSLDITVPVNDPKATQLAGEYRFLGNTFESANTGLAVNNMSGTVRFSEAGLEKGTLTAETFGGDVVIGIDRDSDRELTVNSNGSIPAAGVLRLVGAKLAERISGNIDWIARWRSGPGSPEFHAEFDASKVATRLPPPLDEEHPPFIDKLVLQTELAAPDRHVLAVSGAAVSGQLAFGIENGAWHFFNGHIGFGEKNITLSNVPGIHVSARLNALDIDAWNDLTRGGTSGKLPAVISRISIYVRTLEVFDRRFSGIALDFRRRKSTWRGNINNASISGSVRFEPGSSANRVIVNLDKLRWPDRIRKSAGAGQDPRSLPDMTMRVKSFYLKDRKLGEFNVNTARAPWGIEISKLTLTRPETRLTATGRWRYVSGRHSTEIALQLDSDNLGETMSAWGMPDQLEGGEVELKSNLGWPDSPAAPSFDGLSGRVDIVSKKGRFLRVKQGAGRLFGILDLSSIFGYLILDFSPLFGKGYLYDQIKANLTVERGSAFTRNLTVKGPTANLQIDGRVGIANEDFDLMLAIEPQLSSGLTAATWGIWGPQVAAVVLALQKIFKKQLAAGTRVLYVVKGSWDKPTITRVDKEGVIAPDDQSQEDQSKQSKDD
jgi:uncharacterized protein (TIGR02099 family)